MSLRRSTVVLLACSLLATACGSRLSDEERAQAISAGAGQTDGSGDGGVAEGSPVATTGRTYSVAVTGEPTGGTFTLEATVDDETEETEALAFDADAPAVDAGLEDLPNVGASNVEATGDGPFTVAFVGELADDEVVLAVGSVELTGGTDPGVTVEEIEAPTGGEVAGGTPGGGSGGGGDGGTPGGGGSGGPGGPAACQPGSATSAGVTPTEIKVGNVSQISGLVPGFGQTGVNGVRAYFNMINTLGGVCGRKLTLVTADDRFQSATNRAETEKLAGQVIAFVGSTSVVDDGGAPIIEAKGVADISLTTTAPRTAAKNNFSPNPIDPAPAAGNGSVGILNYFKSTYGVKKAAIFYQDVATGVNQSKNYERDFGKAGIPVVGKYPVAPTATNFRSQATDMKEKGVDIVITVAEVGAISNLARAFKDIDYIPKVPFYGAQTYGKKFLQQAGPAAETTKIGLIFDVPETGNPAIQEFATWYARSSPGADPDFFAILSWVAADMFVQALRDAGPDPTQAKVLAEMRKVTNYTGDGLVGGINPAQKRQPKCFHVLEVKGGKWVKTFPGSGFQCS